MKIQNKNSSPFLYNKTKNVEICRNIFRVQCEREFYSPTVAQRFPRIFLSEHLLVPNSVALYHVV